MTYARNGKRTPPFFQKGALTCRQSLHLKRALPRALRVAPLTILLTSDTKEWGSNRGNLQLQHFKCFTRWWFKQLCHSFVYRWF